jgi:hydroxymethylglutaryl-CoA lyase
MRSGSGGVRPTSDAPAAIRLVEVGPRDGLQNEARTVPTEAKIRFIDALSSTGLEEIEVSSFVSSKWVPQLADAADVFRGIRRASGVIYSALVPNRQGFDGAIAARADKVAVFTAASETFSRRNTNASIAESLDRFRPVLRDAAVPVRGYVSTAFHCPFEGPIAPAQVLPVMQTLFDMGCVEVSIGDTIGKATPDEVRRLLDVLLPHCPPAHGPAGLALHLHDTFGQAVGNAVAAAAMGITTFDSSAGGIGGCPFAPGAPGNVATQALVAAFSGRTGVNSDRLEAAATVVRPYLSTRPRPRPESRA